MTPYLKPTSRFRGMPRDSQLREVYQTILEGAVIISADFAAVFDHHPQDNKNQAILLHSGQFVVIISYSELVGDVRVVRNKAFHYWVRLGILNTYCNITYIFN